MSNFPFRYNEIEYLRAIAERHAKIAANPIHKVLTHPYFEPLYIIPELEKSPENEYIDTQTGEVKTANTDYFSIGYIPNIKKYHTHKLNFVPDGISEFSPKNILSFFWVGIQSFFESALYYDLETIKSESKDFFAFLAQIKAIKRKKSAILENGNDTIFFHYSCYSNNETFIFHTKINVMEWQMYLQNDSIILECYEITFHSKISKEDFFSYFNFQ